MEFDARTLVRARAPAVAPGSALGRGRAREAVTLHTAAARLATVPWHNNVAGLTGAHPDHWVRNPYLWQLVEAGALAGKEPGQAATELRAHRRIAPWTAWPHAFVRRIERMNAGALERLPRTHGELVAVTAADTGTETASQDFSEGPELTIEIDRSHVTLRAEDGTRHVIARVPPAID